MDLETFSALLEQLRPRIHRFCSRMTGSALDGEDLTQEVLLAAYQHAERYDPARPLEPWLFQIAHRKGIDFQRRARRRAPGEVPSSASPPRYGDVRDAMRSLVYTLPPKERACVVLKDVLGFSLSETAQVVESTVAGVKAALHRGREKLRSRPSAPPPTGDAAHLALVEQYVARFNTQDWDGVCALLHEDATLDIVGKQKSTGHDAFRGTYFANHARLDMPWHLQTSWVDAELCTTEHRLIEGRWTVRSVAQLVVRDNKIATVRDYMHVSYVLTTAHIVPAKA